MNLSQFNVSYSNTKVLLKKIKLLKGEGVKAIGSVSDEFLKVSQQDDYLKIYQVAIKNLDYDLLLQDESFFQFSFQKLESDKYPKIRYCFFQNPIYFKTYEEFLEMNNASFDEVGDSFKEFYDQFLNELSINSSCQTIRYDLDIGGYRPLIHSCAHFHIGHANHVRIPCNKMITPLKFAITIIKHIYWPKWKEIYLNNEEELINVIASAKSLCTALDEEVWKKIEYQDLYIM